MFRDQGKSDGHNSDITARITQKGTGLTFLTPGRKAPSLKTTVTRPQNIFLENISPVYMRSVSSPAASQLANIYTSPVLSTGNEAKLDETIKPTVETVTQHGLKIDKPEGPKRNHRSHKNDSDLDELESQVIPGTLFKTEDGVKFPSTSNVLSDFDSHSLTIRNENGSKETLRERNGRRYTTSYCSTCSSSGDESVIARCSVCDGCSSSTCNSLFSQPVDADVLPLGSAGDCGSNVLHPLEMSDVRIEALLDSHLSFDDLDASQGLLKPHEAEPGLQLKDLSLSNEQMIFLLLRMVLSKYKQLTEDLTAERKISTSQRHSVACLIQAIVLLSRRVKNTSDQWHKTQLQLNLIKRDHDKLRRHQRKIYLVICVLLVFNVCNIQAVKQRIMRIVKFFGIVENVRKIIRFRKMVAENWRNIPSLLTDFWRIFIFRSSPRLKNS